MEKKNVAWQVKKSKPVHIGTIEIPCTDVSYDFVLPTKPRGLFKRSNKSGWNIPYVDFLLFELEGYGQLEYYAFCIEQVWWRCGKVNVLLAPTLRDVKYALEFVEEPITYPDFFILFDLPKEPLVNLLSKHNLDEHDFNQFRYREGEWIHYRHWVVAITPDWRWKIDLYMLNKSERFIEYQTFEELLEKSQPRQTGIEGGNNDAKRC